MRSRGAPYWMLSTQPASAPSSKDEFFEYVQRNVWTPAGMLTRRWVQSTSPLIAAPFATPSTKKVRWSPYQSHETFQ